jgi:hypothetical protein
MRPVAAQRQATGFRSHTHTEVGSAHPPGRSSSQHLLPADASRRLAKPKYILFFISLIRATIVQCSKAADCTIIFFKNTELKMIFYINPRFLRACFH